MVWKRKVFDLIRHTRRWLRKNHSGMETLLQNRGHVPTKTRCVRTIVVWKLADFNQANAFKFWLRKNHSGMETSLDLYHHVAEVLLRKNHSGMETILPSRKLWHCTGCVRTIVVWKHRSKGFCRCPCFVA